MTEQHSSTSSGATNRPGASAPSHRADGSGSGSASGSGSGGRKTAGAFDIRVIIGALLGIFGLILLAVSLFGDAQAKVARANEIDLNLWTGLALVAVSAAFIAWERLRPTLVEDPPDEG